VTSSIARPERRLFALGLRLVATICFSLMAVLLKIAGLRGIATPELMFWRQAFALPVVLLFAAATTGLGSLRTNQLRLHITRTVVGLFTMSLTFSSLVLLPLAEATMLGFTVPLFATMLAALIFREPTGWHRWGAVIAGFAGVLIVVQPGASIGPSLGVACGISAAIMVAVMSFLLKHMSRTESPAVITFYFSLTSVVFLAPLLLWFGTSHDGVAWLVLMGIGVTGGMGQIALTGSLRWAPVSVVIGVDYISLVWSTIGGWLVWGALPVAATWIGGPIIVASGLYIAWREHQLQLDRAREVIA
jgi:drug/metabolite transporter (DMT)-like permease